MLVLGIMAAVAAISWPALMRPWSRTLPQQAARELSGQLLDARLWAIEESRVYRFRWRPGTGEYEISAPFAHLRPASEDQQRGDADRRSGFTTQLELPIRTRPETPTATAMQGVSVTPVVARPEAQPKRIHSHLLNDVKFRSDWWPAPPDADAAESSEPVAGQNDSSQQNALQEQLAKAQQNSQQQAAATGDQQAHQHHWPPWSHEEVWFYPDGTTTNGHWQLVSSELVEVDVYLRGMTGTITVGSPRQIIFEESSPNTMPSY